MGTLGRQILEGEKQVRILGQNFPVKARIEKINGFSAHADQKELIDWMSPIENLKKLYLIHGEREKMDIFAEEIRKELGYESHIMEVGNSVTL